ncbi:MAG: hypothetical protein GKS00_11385 [Alphaproteobacteria bacterium]|nr:hypothetical protein [Alphaproteobacteria bacterium]NKC02279.1 hypothetical protein [Pseudomonadales bacterium]
MNKNKWQTRALDSLKKLAELQPKVLGGARWQFYQKYYAEMLAFYAAKADDPELARRSLEAFDSLYPYLDRTKSTSVWVSFHSEHANALLTAAKLTGDAELCVLAQASLKRLLTEWTKRSRPKK